MFKSYVISIAIFLLAFAGNGCVKINNVPTKKNQQEQSGVHNLENKVTNKSAERKKKFATIYEKFHGKNFIIPYADIEMVWIPSGEFEMGDVQGGGESDERPVHTVNINKGFWIGKTEVTQKQWQKVMETNPSRFKGENLPVETVSWMDCKIFCERLSNKTGLPIRLPSEAEWEYACRAGTSTKYYNGNDKEDLKEIGWYWGNTERKTYPVGEKTPNKFGLYDMHGNVWEWCEDRWNDSYNGAPDDGSAWTTGNKETRILRGGSWPFLARYCRSANRIYYSPEIMYSTCGFRIVLAAN